ncbi:MAG: glutathione S-transferase family protein [Hyphomonadaceae bacterium]
MLQLLYDATPNVWKVTILLEECGLPYDLKLIDLRAGDQFTDAYLRINPNGKVPALIDNGFFEPGTAPVTIFESGAIMLYLAEKTGKLVPKDAPGRYQVVQWLMWQMSGLGPTLGQNGHFLLYAADKIPYAVERFGAEARRLYGVAERQLKSTGAYFAGEYSIADIACFPWIMTHKRQGISLDEYPSVRQWFANVRARPAVQRGLAAAGGPGSSARAPA